MKLPSRVPIITWFVVAALCVVTSVLISSESLAARHANGNSSNVQVHKRGKKKPPKQVNHCSDPTPSNQAASKCTLGTDKPFVAGCTLPFSGSVSHPVDEHCPNEGCTNNPPDITQNRIKNNFCATGTPVEISFNSIDRLQADVDKMVTQHKISYGKGPPSGPPQPNARPKISSGKLDTIDKNGHPVKIGEGDLVTIDAFVLDAKHDDTFPFGFGGETVNCKNSLLEWNDIHIALGRTATMGECNSVTAEIVPHFRPAVWDRFDSNSCTSRHVTSPLPVKGIRVRITGQLFFDGSHLPNSCSKPHPGGNPLRRSVWEVHPVYKIEVFDVASSSFITLEQWAAQH